MESCINFNALGATSAQKITEDIYYIGIDDRRLDKFENSHETPNGMAYNSYLILDEKTALFDGIDNAVREQYLANLMGLLNGRELDYIIVQHVEPDHCSTLADVFRLFPNARIYLTKAALPLIKQFLNIDVSDRAEIIKDGSTLPLGRHELSFYTAAMVHWPEVMVSYDSYSKVLFSADAFGSFGSLNGNLFADCVDFEKDYLCEARRYYSNIVGKYGKQVQMLLKKLSGLDIQYICSLHGLVWRKNLAYIMEKYMLWSGYVPEDKGSVVIFYGSIYGGTERAANVLAALLHEKGINNISVYDASKTELSQLVSEAFRADKLVFACATYNLGIFTPMKTLLHELKDHLFQNRDYFLIENGSWSPAAAKEMEIVLSSMPNMRKQGDSLLIKSRLDKASLDLLKKMAEDIKNTIE